jgi:hypothetical protein
MPRVFCGYVGPDGESCEWVGWHGGFKRHLEVVHQVRQLSLLVSSRTGEIQGRLNTLLPCGCGNSTYIFGCMMCSHSRMAITAPPGIDPVLVAVSRVRE